MLGKKDKLLKFFKLVQDGKFPFNNIAFELFLDIAEWFDKDESRQMRYSPSTLQFFWLGRKLFGGRFIQFMSGPKNDLQRRIGVETRLKGYTYFEIERDFFNKLGVLIDGDFKFDCTATCFCSFPWR